MIIPDMCLKYIKLQRHGSGYKNISKGYIKDITNEFNGMLKFLPESCNFILDIGCGIAGIDILLSNNYNNPKLYLLDNSKQSEKIVYGFNKVESYYNSFDATKKMMDINKIKNYKLIDINKGFPKIENIDIIFSLLACGFHFSITDYIEYIYNSISTNGVLILDIRKEMEWQIKMIERFFKSITIIETKNPKTIRICAGGKKNWIK